MVRSITTIALIFVTMLYGIATGHVDLPDQTGGEQVISQSADLRCCEPKSATFELPSRCQIECHALLPRGVSVATDLVKIHDASHVNNFRLTPLQIELPPPIA